MGHITPSIPVVGQPHSTEDPKVRNALIVIRNAINGNLDGSNVTDGAVTKDKVADALAMALGIKNAAVDGRGYAAVATSQSTTSSSFTDLSTPGPSVEVDVPANGFVMLYAEADVTGPTTGASLVGVHEPTDLVTPELILSQPNGSSGTRRSDPGNPSGTSGIGTFILLPATAGARVYTLKYARFTGGTGNATFANRKLWVVGGGPA